MTGWHILVIVAGLAVAVVGAFEVAVCRCEHQDQEDRQC